VSHVRCQAQDTSRRDSLPEGACLRRIEARHARGRVALGLDLRDQRGDVETTVRGSVRAQAPGGLPELALAAHPVLPSGLVPGDGDVDEALEEVALPGVGRTPGILESLVGREVLGAANQVDAALVVLRE
jgi:hypothetical protein